MSSPEALAQQAQAVARVRAARLNREQAAAQFDKAIRDAYAAGCAVRDIAAAADITRQRVFQIVHPTE